MTRRPKGWSTRDRDHVAVGSIVLLKRRAEEIHPSIVDVRDTFGITDDATSLRAEVKHRVYGSGHYMVKIEGSRLSIAVERDDFFFPIPDGVVPISTARRLK